MLIIGKSMAMNHNNPNPITDSYFHSVARTLLAIQLLLVTTLMWRGTTDIFETIKVAWVWASTICLMILGLFAAGWHGWSATWRTARQILTEPMMLGVVVLLGSAIISTIFSRAPLVSWRGDVETIHGLPTVAALCGCVFAARLACFDWRGALQILSGVLIGSTLACVYAIFQLYGLDPLKWNEVSEIAGYTRPFGTLGNPNHLAGLLACVIPIFAAYTIYTWLQRQFVKASILSAITGLHGFALIATYSRGGLLAVAVSMGIFALVGIVWLSRVVRWAGLGTAIATVLVVLGISLIIPEQFQYRISRIHQDTARIETWKAAFTIFTDSPLIGSGLDTFRLAFTPHRSALHWEVEAGRTPTHAHNEVLQLLATQGLLGGLGLLIVVAGVLRTLYPNGCNQGFPLKLARLALFSSLSGIAVVSLVSFNAIAVGTTVAVIFGCYAALTRQNLPSTTFVSTSGHGLLVIVSCVCVSILLLNVSYDSSVTLNLCIVSTIVALTISLGVAYLGFNTPRWNVGHLAVATFCLVAGLGMSVWFIHADAVSADAERIVLRRSSAVLDSLEEAVRLDPRSPKHWTRLGEAALRFGSIQRACEAFHTVCRLVPGDAQAHLNYARAWAERSRAEPDFLSRTWVEFEAAIALDPHNADFYATAGRSAVMLNAYSQAEDFIRRGLTIHPQSGQLAAIRGMIACSQRNFQLARTLLDDALEQFQWYGNDREKRVALTALAIAQEGSGNYSAAWSIYTALLEQDPKCEAAKRGLQRLSLAVQRYK